MARHLNQFDVKANLAAADPPSLGPVTMLTSGAGGNDSGLAPGRAGTSAEARLAMRLTVCPRCRPILVPDIGSVLDTAMSHYDGWTTS